MRRVIQRGERVIAYLMAVCVVWMEAFFSSYPDFDDTRIHAEVPPEAPAKRKRGRKPKPKA